MLDLRHGELGSQALIRHDERHVGVHRILGDHDTGGVGGTVACEALQDLGRVDHVADLGVTFVDAAEVRALLQRFVQGDLQVFGDHLGDLQRPGERHFHYLGDVLENRAGLQRSERGDLRHVVHAVAFLYVVDDLASSLDAEVHVDIRHGDALDVEETLEDEAEFDRVNICYFHGIGHDGACGGAAPRAYHDAVALRPVDEVPYDEEVTHVAHGLDCLHLVAHAVAKLRIHVGSQGFHVFGRHRRIGPAAGRMGLCLAIAVLQTRPAQIFEVALLGVAVGHGADRDVVVSEFEVEVALIHDLLGHIAGLGDIGEDLPHLLLGLQVELIVGEAHAVGIGVVGFRTDAQ